MRTVFAVLVVAGVLALPTLAESGIEGKTSTVLITFTGQGGGRYLDVSRWLEADDHACYARQTADEMLALKWSITWKATFVRKGGRDVLVRRTRTKADVNGGVKGTSVRDYCTEPEEGPTEIGPDWPGTTTCNGALGLRAQGAFQVKEGARRTLLLRGPTFGSPPSPCELDVRNDQLVAAVRLDDRMISRLAAGGGTATIPVGTSHPGPGVTYEATRNCTPFPHLYDGIIYLYECSDTLTWAGRVSLSRSAP